MPKQAGLSSFRNHHAFASLPALIQFSINFYFSVNTVPFQPSFKSFHFLFVIFILPFSSRTLLFSLVFTISDRQFVSSLLLTVA